LNETDRFARRVVRQTQNDDVRLVQYPCPRADLLAVSVGQLENGQIATRGEPFPDFKPRRTGSTVNENSLCHHDP